MAGQQNAGCGLLIVGFILGWGFAVITRPEQTTQPYVPPPAASYIAPSPAPSAPPTQAPADLPADVPTEPLTGQVENALEAPAPISSTQELTQSIVEDPPQQFGGPTDTEIRRRIVQQSIESYSGACPCPYNVMRNGRRCGGNSAYSRPGGASPICYPEDVSDAEISRFRAANY